MFPNWKREAASKPKSFTSDASNAPTAKPNDGDCCSSGKVDSDATKPTGDGAPKPAKKKGGCCGG